MNSSIYLDYAAATFVDKDCLNAMLPFFKDDFYNPSATYLGGRDAKKSLESFRHEIAVCLGAKASEIIFTAGATEANNLAIQGIMKKFPDAEIIISSIEHESVIAPASLYKKKQVAVDKHGTVDLNHLTKLISNKTVLVSIMMINNEIGTSQPIRKVSNILRNIRDKRKEQGNNLPILLHTDAAQAPNYFDIKPNRTGIDLMSVNGGKIYGPKQSGFLYIKAGVNLKPLIYGGGQERDLRPGTENLAFAAGMATAIIKSQKNAELENQRVRVLKELFAKELQKINKKIKFNGLTHSASPHILSVTFPGTDNETLMMRLDEAGVICAVGSACSASEDEPSHVLSAIGLSESDAGSTIRFSFGKATSRQQLLKTAETIANLL